MIATMISGGHAELALGARQRRRVARARTRRRRRFAPASGTAARTRTTSAARRAAGPSPRRSAAGSAPRRTQRVSVALVEALLRDQLVDERAHVGALGVAMRGIGGRGVGGDALGRAAASARSTAKHAANSASERQQEDGGVRHRRDRRECYHRAPHASALSAVPAALVRARSRDGARRRRSARLDAAARAGPRASRRAAAAALAGHRDGHRVSRIPSASPPASTRTPRTSPGLATLGFGFLEVGTVTPRPQPGNPKPRMFRLPRARSARSTASASTTTASSASSPTCERARYRGVLGINIGKNFDTPNERAADDYLSCLRAVYAHASYVTVNISSPNTKGLRDLQAEDAARARCSRAQGRAGSARAGARPPRAAAVKIAPDLDADAIARHRAAARRCIAIDGVIATNTTIARDAVAGQPHADEPGGLSGAPAVREDRTRDPRRSRRRSTARCRSSASAASSRAPTRKAKIDAGATLVQLYTGLIYRGPALVAECVEALARR